jgi:hypothetical protein
MDTKQPIVQDEKSTKHYEEKTDLEKVKPGLLENADYTGAEAKTDPAEIALVRKIDWRLMVCFLKRNRWEMQSSDRISAYINDDVFFELR